VSNAPTRSEARIKRGTSLLVSLKRHSRALAQRAVPPLDRPWPASPHGSVRASRAMVPSAARTAP